MIKTKKGADKTNTKRQNIFNKHYFMIQGVINN